MLNESAIRLVNQLIYKPDWEIVATDHVRRFEGTISIRITIPTYQSERRDAPTYGNAIRPYADFAILAGDCEDDVSLYRKVLECIMDVELHEAREFLRVQPTKWAPFHPHRIDGMKRYGTVDHDLTYGLA